MISVRGIGEVDIAACATGAQFANAGKSVHRHNARFTESGSFVAIKNIPEGREILCGYGRGYWRERDIPAIRIGRHLHQASVGPVPSFDSHERGDVLVRAADA